MANPPKKKGTGGETELLRLLAKLPGSTLVRTPASSNVDLARPGGEPVINVLATRPDRGEWLITMDLETFKTLVWAWERSALRVEVKRYARFALHAIWQKKFGTR